MSGSVLVLGNPLIDDIVRVIRSEVCGVCPLRKKPRQCVANHIERCEAMYRLEAAKIAAMLENKYMIDSSKPIKKGTLRYKFTKWFCDNVNFCHGFLYDEYDEAGNPVPKPDNKVYNFFYHYWLWPFVQTNCMCCNTVRGLIYGGVLGYILGKLL